MWRICGHRSVPLLCVGGYTSRQQPAHNIRYQWQSSSSTVHFLMLRLLARSQRLVSYHYQLREVTKLPIDDDDE